MRALVMKFGGTSVATSSHLRRVAKRIIQTRRRGLHPVVVVSARGDTTDRLLRVASQVAARPRGRELDVLLSTGEQEAMALLAMAIQDMGWDAVSLTGAQGGILTDENHTRARIISVRPDRIRAEIGAGRIPIVAGFQGVNGYQDITTLGRGGSDTTAVALAAALGLGLCEIYTDVEGVFTADPRVVPKAQLIPRISYHEMLELAGRGARVVHLRAVEIAKKYQVRIHVRSSFTEGEGTYIEEVGEVEKGRVVTGIAHEEKVAKVTITGVPDRPGVAATLFQALGQRGVVAGMIVQSAPRGGVNDITFTVAVDQSEEALEVTKEVAAELGAAGCFVEGDVARVSIVGAGMLGHPGVAGAMFGALGRAGINIQLISTSDISISCAVARSDLGRALEVLHRQFELEREA